MVDERETPSVFTDHSKCYDRKKDGIMYVVIDVQGMRGRDNQFIPKEVAVVSVKTEDSGHWVVKPPYTDDNLPAFVKSQNMWLQETR